MPEKIDLEKILEANPHIDREELERSEELRRKLRELGIRGKQYDLAPVLGGRRVTMLDDAHADSRPIRSKRRRDTT